MGLSVCGSRSQAKADDRERFVSTVERTTDQPYNQFTTSAYFEYPRLLLLCRL